VNTSDALALIALAKERYAAGVCQQCGQLPDWRGLQTHHIRHKGMGGTKHVYGKDELIRLCGKCHDSEHGIKDADSSPQWGNG
jgi:5-methylcytosine-specific restriction endonuclease McrA